MTKGDVTNKKRKLEELSLMTTLTIRIRENPLYIDFGHGITLQGIIILHPQIAKYNWCGASYACDTERNGTTNMRHHLLSQYKKFPT